MDEKIEFIVLSSLLHDIGKLFERGQIFQDARKDEYCLSFCPDKNNRSTHLHSAYTRMFCDWLENKFDCLYQTKDRSWKDWCAAHHRNDETGLEASVIRISDRLSSGEREEGEFYLPDIHRRTYLEPVTEKVFLFQNSQCLFTQYRYPLNKLTSEKDSFFPKSGMELGLPSVNFSDGDITDPKKWRHLISETPLEKEYQLLGNGLLDEIHALSQKNRHIPLTDLNICLTTLLERYTANVPSATNLRHPDISLFDHLRTTAAIAQSLYLYKRHYPDSPLEKPDDAKWLLVCGDFSGIQKFIYRLTNKGAAKGLRGRSFYVQYFCRLCADFILHQLHLTKAALLYNSGGKFYMLLPAHLKPAIFESRKQINQWLLKEFGGNVFFGIGAATVTSEMFSRGNMHSAWEEAANDLELDRSAKFKELLTDPDFFEPESDFDPVRSCEVCGTRKIGKNHDRCRMCESLAELGSWLKKTDAILTIRGGNEEAERFQTILNTKKVLSVAGLESHAFFLEEYQMKEIAGKHIDGECILLNKTGNKLFSELELPCCALSTLSIGKWDSDRQIRDDGMSWDFEDYADHAKGISRMGILRMDVDNLGMVFIKGLYFPKREQKGWGRVITDSSGVISRKPMASISRMATLSRQLNHFFSGYITTLMERDDFNRCQIIYSGGDDLFVIGSWDQLPELAKTVRSEFNMFCCQNPDFSISGGLSLQRGKYPIYKGAQISGQAEKKAKEVRKIWKPASHDLEKDGFCFLNAPMVWEDMQMAEIIKTILEDELKNNNKGLPAYLSEMTASNMIKAENISRKKGISIADAWQSIKYDSWRWRSAYQLRRRYQSNADIEKWSELLFTDNINKVSAVLPVYTWLELPLRWTDYLHREKGGK